MRLYIILYTIYIDLNYIYIYFCIKSCLIKKRDKEEVREDRQRGRERDVATLFITNCKRERNNNNNNV